MQVDDIQAIGVMFVHRPFWWVIYIQNGLAFRKTFDHFGYQIFLFEKEFYKQHKNVGRRVHANVLL